jgi:hypothetical protein
MTLTDELVELDVDLDLEIPCEYTAHGLFGPDDEPARYEIRSTCPPCNKSKRLLCCHSDLMTMFNKSGYVKCRICKSRNPSLDCIKILRSL